MDSIESKVIAFIQFLVQKTRDKELRWQQVRWNTNVFVASIDKDKGKASVELSRMVVDKCPIITIRIVVRSSPHMMPFDYTVTSDTVPQLKELHEYIEKTKKMPTWVENWMNEVIKDSGL